jgi:thiosulfate/3-mercaptopyruvate sulfurtransferase
MIFALLFFLSLAYGEPTPEPVHAPTIYFEKTPPPPQKTPKPNLPVLLDSRPAFEYAVGHFPNSISIRWQDYSQTQDPHKGALDPDLNLLSRKLRYLGVSPDKEVIVLGSGAKGQGEDGRIAWMLTYLGIKKISLQNIDNLPGRKTTEDVAENESASPWNPHIVESLRCRKSEIDKILKEHKDDVTILDVRTKEEFKKHIPTALNISWVEFLNKRGEPANREDVLKILEQNHISASQRIIVYSDQGLTSAYVTFVLYKAGLRVSHYDGSFNEWAGDSRDPIEVTK